jgi:hypothetical protein
MGRRRKSLRLSTRENACPRAHVNALALFYSQSHHERRIQNTVPCITKRVCTQCSVYCSISVDKQQRTAEE